MSSRFTISGHMGELGGYMITDKFWGLAEINHMLLQERFIESAEEVGLATMRLCSSLFWEIGPA